MCVSSGRLDRSESSRIMRIISAARRRRGPTGLESGESGWTRTLVFPAAVAFFSLLSAAARIEGRTKSCALRPGRR